MGKLKKKVNPGTNGQVSTISAFKVKTEIYEINDLFVVVT